MFLLPAPPRAALASAVLVVLAGGCAAPAPGGAAAFPLAEGLLLLESGDPAAAGALLERDPLPAGALARFHAEALAARVHAVASLGAAFRTEITTAGGRGGPLGGPPSEAATRPSPTSHLVALLYHAAQARAQTAAAAADQQAGGDAILPAALAALEVEEIDAELELLSAVAYARLGFRAEVDSFVARSPALVDLEGFPAALDRRRVPAALRPWVGEMVSHHLRSRDEVAAYRFGVLAIEGAERFGHALPPEVVAEIERWIVAESRYLFVCPESQTPFLPGARRSPKSGIPHLEYVPVERPRGGGR
ncbi:MAG: hypothetical protein AB1726_09060 [Planctomycetota bacterium]